MVVIDLLFALKGMMIAICFTLWDVNYFFKI